MIGLLLTAILIQTAPAGSAPVSAPSAEALALGKRLAAGGGLATLLPLVIEKDISELAAEDKTLTPAERERLVAIGRRHGVEGRERLIAALAKGYAAKLSVVDLQTLVAQAEQPATAKLRQIEPLVIVGAMQALGPTDLKKETAQLFCKETGKLCNRR